MPSQWWCNRHPLLPYRASYLIRLPGVCLVILHFFPPTHPAADGLLPVCVCACVCLQPTLQWSRGAFVALGDLLSNPSSMAATQSTHRSEAQQCVAPTCLYLLSYVWYKIQNYKFDSWFPACFPAALGEIGWPETVPPSCCSQFMTNTPGMHACRLVAAAAASLWAPPGASLSAAWAPVAPALDRDNAAGVPVCSTHLCPRWGSSPDDLVKTRKLAVADPDSYTVVARGVADLYP